MSYLEELLPEFRKGAKIRCNHWGEEEYVYLEGDEIIDNNNKATVLDGPQIVSNSWELYQKPIDWDYIINNKCLCWFWDYDESHKILGFLIKVNENKKLCHFVCKKSSRDTYDYAYCRPVRRDEVTFYENKKDE